MKEKMEEYARLIVRTGVNLQKGQTLVVNCPVECAFFGRLVANEAYDAGAREVVVHWTDDTLSRMRFLKADDTVFDKAPSWLKTFYNEYADQKAALISIMASDPENLKGVEPERIQRDTLARGIELKEYQNRMITNEFAWCAVSIPTAAWASKVFPGVSSEEAIDMLWNAILHTSRVTGDRTSAEKWREHLSRLNERIVRLNDYHFSSLVYQNGLGTNLSVELPEKHIWMCGQEKTKTGITFVANIPTEEIFTIPKKDGVNGVVYSSMPLSLSGNLIKDIKFTLLDGKIVDVDAQEGLEHLINKLDMDEGARYLGEVALVPHKSLISEQNVLYYNTLFDENACCHFAFGKAVPALVNAENMTMEEIKACGGNDSIVHVDFMVGTPDLKITGVTLNGNEIPVFEDGNFVF